MSTSENEQYGGGWQRCHRCGVKDRPDQVVHVEGAVDRDDKPLYRHVDARAEKCAEWKATLERATPVDLVKAESSTIARYKRRRAEKDLARAAVRK